MGLKCGSKSSAEASTAAPATMSPPDDMLFAGDDLDVLLKGSFASRGRFMNDYT